MKKYSKKAQQVGIALLMVTLIISIFAFGLYTGSKNQGITGAATGLESVTGHATIEAENFEEGTVYYFNVNEQGWTTGENFRSSRPNAKSQNRHGNHGCKESCRGDQSRKGRISG